MSTSRKCTPPKLNLDTLINKIVLEKDIRRDNTHVFRNYLHDIGIDSYIDHILYLTLTKLEGGYHLKKEQVKTLKNIAKRCHANYVSRTQLWVTDDIIKDIRYFIGISPIDTSNALYDSIIKTTRETTMDSLYNLNQLQENINKLFPLINGIYKPIEAEFKEITKHDPRTANAILKISGIHRSHMNCYNLLYVTVYTFIKTFMEEYLNHMAYHSCKSLNLLDEGTVA